VRELGRKLIVNPGSCGYAFDGQASACWALVTFDDESEPTAELFRPAYDAQAAADEVGERGLAGDVYRAATIRTGRFVR
jgi:diadenosine tetraphosphatase ApaH/serine/threonine PP2A family protein phosphatase